MNGLPWSMIKSNLRLVCISFAVITMVSTQVASFQWTKAWLSALFESPKDCLPNNGWISTLGPEQPETATAAQQALNKSGIIANVRARSFGERDSCDHFKPLAIDFTVTLMEKGLVDFPRQQGLAKTIYQTLSTLSNPTLGEIRIVIPETEETYYLVHDRTQDRIILSQNNWLESEMLTPSLPADLPQTNAATSNTDIYNRNVYVIVYDPLLSNGKLLSEHLGWQDHTALTQGTVDFFMQASSNRMAYAITETTILTDGWPIKTDGFQYTEQEYLDVLSGQATPHSPDAVDYNLIVNDPVLDICGKANRGEIDEVWIYNGPYFGFAESRLVGPGAYWFNSLPVPGPHNCNRLIPIMGPSPERTLNSAIHNFGHRTESTMTRVYGSWNQNSITHSWEKFALIDVKSPDYSYSGCGNTHYPPNGRSDYDYGNSGSALTNCDDFINYPNLSEPADVLQSVTCSNWSCVELDYHTYWFSHLPANIGCGTDDVANDWWVYFADPALANDPSEPCSSPSTNTPTPTSTNTPTPTSTSTPTPTYTTTSTPTSTSTNTPTPTHTATPTPTSTSIPTPTFTATPIRSVDFVNFLPIVLD